MLDPKVTELARTMIQVRFDERREQLRRGTIQITHEMAVKGMSNSTMTLSRFYYLYADEIKIWADIVWEELKKSYYP